MYITFFSTTSLTWALEGSLLAFVLKMTFVEVQREKETFPRHQKIKHAAGYRVSLYEYCSLSDKVLGHFTSSVRIRESQIRKSL